MKYQFEEIFEKNNNGTLSPKDKAISIGGVVFGPGVSFGKGVLFGGINIFDFIDKDIEADETNNVLVIRGFYGR